jgi:hypothetical protein
MARKSLRPHLNQIRAWTRQGRTDAWVAHQLEVTVQQIQDFKRENGLLDGDEQPEGRMTEFDEEIDLRAEDDALIAAELEAVEAARTDEDAHDGERSEGESVTEAAARRRRRGRRGGRGRRGNAAQRRYEGTFDHGEEGYGLWLDPEIAEDPLYAEHWAGHRPVEVAIEEDRIVIRRAAPGGEDEDEE